jgi:hypothetical protein
MRFLEKSPAQLKKTGGISDFTSGQSWQNDASRISRIRTSLAGWRQRAQEMFVPLVHPPGHAQADFGEAIGIIGLSMLRVDDKTGAIIWQISTGPLCVGR